MHWKPIKLRHPDSPHFSEEKRDRIILAVIEERGFPKAIGLPPLCMQQGSVLRQQVVSSLFLSGTKKKALHLIQYRNVCMDEDNWGKMHSISTFPSAWVIQADRNSLSKILLTGSRDKGEESKNTPRSLVSEKVKQTKIA